MPASEMFNNTSHQNKRNLCVKMYTNCMLRESATFTYTLAYYANIVCLLL